MPRSKKYKGITLLSRHEENQKWDEIINPDEYDLYRAYLFLSNEFNDYVEYKNCGAIFRFIRSKDLSKYIARSSNETQPQGGSSHKKAKAI